MSDVVSWNVGLWRVASAVCLPSSLVSQTPHGSPLSVTDDCSSLEVMASAESPRWDLDWQKSARPLSRFKDGAVAISIPPEGRANSPTYLTGAANNLASDRTRSI
jgi:hypothetical protein